MDDGVAGEQAGPVKPPLVAAEEQVRVGDVADARRAGAVPFRNGDGEALRGDESAIAAIGGVFVVVMQPVGIMHRLRPAADVVLGNRVAQLPCRQRHAHDLVELGAIERLFLDCGHWRIPSRFLVQRRKLQAEAATARPGRNCGASDCHPGRSALTL